MTYLAPVSPPVPVPSRDPALAILAVAEALQPDLAKGFQIDALRLRLEMERAFGGHLAQNRTPRGVSATRLEHSLRQVEPDRDDLRHDRPPSGILADPPWHIDAVGGRSHHQCPLK
jgi:hypothetical protein